MNRWIVPSAAALLGAVGLFLSAGQASAHVGYGNSLYSDSSIIDPVRPLLPGDVPQYGTGIVNATPGRVVSSNAGYVAGLDPTTWANSHDQRFLYFNLAQTMTVDFTINGTANTNGADILNPGYSIFQGVFLNSVHDGAVNPVADGTPGAVAAYNANQTGMATWSPFAAVVNGAYPGGTTEHWGQYRSNTDITMANDGVAAKPATSNAAIPPTAFTLHYLNLTGAADPNGLNPNSISGHYTLGPGIYSLVVGGNNQSDLDAYLGIIKDLNGTIPPSNDPNAPYNIARLARNFTVDFAVAPVPIPAAVYLFGSGLVGIVAFARRRMTA